jgi:hypothetical protein
MTEEEIKKAVEVYYLEFTEYLRKVEGFLAIPSMNDLILWELWKERKHKEDIQQEVHQIIQEVSTAPDD